MSAGAYTGGANNGRLKINGGGKKKKNKFVSTVIALPRITDARSP